MKHLYLVITLFCISVAYGQEAPAQGEIDGLKLYPNPVTDGRVFVSTKDYSPKQISIYDVLGTQVLKTSITGDALLVSELDAGVYVLRVYQNKRVATRKLIVK
ncbi:T9SS type A sorting domain-containing protein [Pricia sp. S334]|uniref:T9SS type A sorting domain-containing protein n=1 Tax=Pricia mediterranea TaxID=3076079 RepID=A0ABU3L4Y4_9FLAO|nr:T9SS type A sorting domain-containing protein [Pricia sp. S334]MDT7828497.1 T9SS type A sorting domain-containing protein [Pricia sp. S334]